MGKGNQWGHTVTEAIGSTCNIRKLTGKDKSKGNIGVKHMDIRTKTEREPRVVEMGIHAQDSVWCAISARRHH